MSELSPGGLVSQARKVRRKMPCEGLIRLRKGSGLEEGSALAVGTTGWLVGVGSEWERAA